MSERLTWREIKEKYPCQWIGLTDVVFENNDGVNVQSAVVKYDKEDRDTLTLRVIRDKEDLFVTHTDPDSEGPTLGFLGVKICSI